MEPLHSIFKMFFIPTKKGSFKNCSLRGSLGNQNDSSMELEPLFFKNVDLQSCYFERIDL